MDAAEHLHHCALAGAVLTQEGVDLARLARELRAVERHDAAEPLVDPSRAKKWHDRKTISGTDKSVRNQVIV
jgi:hypothetical protein